MRKLLHHEKHINVNFARPFQLSSPHCCRLESRFIQSSAENANFAALKTVSISICILFVIMHICTEVEALAFRS